MSNILPKTTTVGTTVDAWIADFHARLSSLEVTAKADESKVVTWLKANWAHLVTWASSGVAVAKLFGKL